MTSRPDDLNPEREAEPTVIRDKRRIDPTTGEVRAPEGDASGAADAAPGAGPVGAQPGAETAEHVEDGLGGAAAALAEERLKDLQRLQAEYVNYRKRVERDRTVARDQAVAGVLEALLPVLDDIELARQHGDLAEGPFASIAEKLETTLGRYGLVRYGAPGDEFDPNIHDALMHATSADATTTSVTMIMQPGYTINETVLRPARVGVTSPE